MRATRGSLLVLALPLLLLAACGGDPEPPCLSGIPVYPGASPGAAMAGFAPGGGMGGNLAQYTTQDSYDDVLAFYQRALASRQPQVQTFTTDMGRQAALTMPQEEGAITVAIQEFVEERAVNVTLMAVGRT